MKAKKGAAAEAEGFEEHQFAGVSWETEARLRCV